MSIAMETGPRVLLRANRLAIGLGLKWQAKVDAGLPVRSPQRVCLVTASASRTSTVTARLRHAQMRASQQTSESGLRLRLRAVEELPAQRALHACLAKRSAPRISTVMARLRRAQSRVRQRVSECGCRVRHRAVVVQHVQLLRLACLARMIVLRTWTAMVLSRRALHCARKRVYEFGLRRQHRVDGAKRVRALRLVCLARAAARLMLTVTVRSQRVQMHVRQRATECGLRQLLRVGVAQRVLSHPHAQLARTSVR